ncbi:GSCFA family protein [Candidatus Rhodobacter oscarellae]|uniref:GSCFA family protein n=1 Tax=Candidatus Rhodobacter oscarellae TaxID=1675527 RepID=A0A0J9EBI1_9RHOB|nr:GSCFA domain-containing protein [Candidatus Rhodobacter lobularis]KMW60120.1 GSCFA family protein [Candidatus Rhodobacter lobularis]
MDQASPYSDLPARAFWRTGVAARAPLDPGDLYRPRFRLGKGTRVMTAGSCFAQHVGAALRDAGVQVIDTETVPKVVADAAARRYGYRLYSARYGNIYTARHLLQLLREATEDHAPALPVWQRGERFFDAQRPAVEPDGLASADEVMAHRRAHLGCVTRALRQAEVFVFTFGLTEAWEHRESGTVYPTAPGTIAGAYDPDIFGFRNFNVGEVLADFQAVRELLRRINPQMRFLLTVSPVPLTATASGAHVEAATSYSKATLRAACGVLYDTFEDVDYVPSYEVITSLNSRGAYFDANQRSVTPQGVAAAMGMFLGAHGFAARPAALSEAPVALPEGQPSDAICEDLLLEAFAS